MGFGVFGEMPGDQRLCVAGQVPEAGVPQHVRGFPGGEVEAVPQSDHVGGWPEKGSSGVGPPEVLPRLVADLAEFGGCEGVPKTASGEGFWERVAAVAWVCVGFHTARIPERRYL